VSNRPNLGGSGAPRTRIDWAVNKKFIKEPQLNVPFEHEYDLNLYLSGDTIVCLECGGDYRSLGMHLSISHAMPSSMYKKKYNIPKTRSLRGENTRSLASAAMVDTWKTNQKMEKVRTMLKENIENLTEISRAHKQTSNIRQKNYKGICHCCRKEFFNKRSNRKWCSQECYHADPETINRIASQAQRAGQERAKGKRDSKGKFA